MHAQRLIATLIGLAAAIAVAGSDLVTTPRGASPGAEDRVLALETRCPTFTWEPVPGALFSQLIAYRLPAGDGAASLATELEAEDEVLYAEVPGGAGAWTPSAEQCLEPGGRYVWFVRAALEASGDEVVAASEWSRGRYFEVPGTPSIEDVRQALELLRRSAGGGEPDVLNGTPPPVGDSDTKSPTPPIGRSAAKSVPTASAAIRGAHPDTSGEAYGVVGSSASVDGAGVAAANTAGGADLVLDGSADGLPDASLSQSGLDLPSAATAQTFTLGNSAGGGFTLQVDGFIAGDGSLLTGISATDADTLDGQHGSFYLDASNLRAGLLASDRLGGVYSQMVRFTNPANSFTGSGTGLTGVTADDADTLDGEHGGFYQDAGNLNRGTLSPDRFSALADLLAEGYLGDAPGDLAQNNTNRQRDLNADLLDGQHGVFYLDASNLSSGVLSDSLFSAYHDLGSEGRLDLSDDGDLPTRLQADGRFVNVDGDVMSGLLRIDRNSIALRMNVTTVDETRGDEPKLELLSSTGPAVFTLDSEGDVTATSFSGDGSGLTGIAADDVECPGCVGTADLANGAVTSSKLAADSITSAAIVNGTVLEADLAASAVTSAKIADGTVVANDLATAAVTNAKIQDGAVAMPKLAAGAVSEDKIVSNAVTETKIATGAVSAAKLAPNSVTEAKIATGAVTSAKIASGAVTAAKVSSSEVQLRVSGVCSSGSAIRTIAADGSVTCQTSGSGDLTPPVELTGTLNSGAVLSVTNLGSVAAISGLAVGTPGVFGQTNADGGIGVNGSAVGDHGLGVKGVATGSDGAGVIGEATGDGSTGVKGLGFSQGGYFESTVLSFGVGIRAKGGSSGNAAIFEGNVLIKDRDTGDTLIELGKGLDYAEGFDVSDAEPLEAGTVLVIDPSAPGELARSRQPYDTRVAGIIAGANGLGSGVRLGAGGFDHDVALAGRVYCKVDATEHGIEPGDLLTTAALPGHAMKATEPDRARGAILGKAMEPLEAGTTGRILVLVSLQ